MRANKQPHQKQVPVLGGLLSPAEPVAEEIWADQATVRARRTGRIVRNKSPFAACNDKYLVRSGFAPPIGLWDRRCTAHRELQAVETSSCTTNAEKSVPQTNEPTLHSLEITSLLEFWYLFGRRPMKNVTADEHRSRSGTIRIGSAVEKHRNTPIRSVARASRA